MPKSFCVGHLLRAEVGHVLAQMIGHNGMVRVSLALLSRQPVLRMPLVMAHEHHADTLRANFKKEMIGKAMEVCPPETLLHEVKPERVVRDLFRNSAWNSSESRAVILW